MRMRILNVLTGVTALSLAQAALTIDSLARDIQRVEAIREIKDTTKQFAQLAQYGRFNEMADQFSNNATLRWGPNSTATGPSGIEKWLRADAGKMDGLQPGSLNTWILENPLVSLSVDGLTAKGRWNGLRFAGDGVGKTRIEGGVYENSYMMVGEEWKIERLGYHPLYAGPYVGGWRNVGGDLPLVPYHFTPERTGVPVPEPVGEAPVTMASVEDLEKRVERMNDEDEVRNLQHAYGYYVDRRMWSDVVDLFVSNSTAKIDGLGTYAGSSGVRQAMEKRDGPEGLTQGFLNDRPIFDTIVEVLPGGQEAIARGLEVGMLGNANVHVGTWEFSVFRNRFVKDNGVWKMKELDITPLVAANYSTGWGLSGQTQISKEAPPFLNITSRSSYTQEQNKSEKIIDLADLKRRLIRSAAFDGAENESAAYGYYLDDLQCNEMGAIFAAKGHKASPFAGWFQTPKGIADACYAVWGNQPATRVRSSISFHWRPQPVILISQDGRSATLRARLLQPSTSKTSAGSFNGAMYHDQVVLEDGKWKLWSITIDEFYWQSKDWVGGWAAAIPRNSSAPNPTGNTKIKPNVTLHDVGDREAGFEGGDGRYIAWPEIQRMWFAYRNPVSGRVPEHYWPGCVPCHFKTEWNLTSNGYQEPLDGP
ncbi:hypothetical protein B0J14DRAFT_256881 [Halenospora varia]|nr:hypothetical protein B0J14DRAFT_256881 [Halenospora varia]